MITRLRLAVSRVANTQHHHELQTFPLLERSILPVLTFASLLYELILLLKLKLYQWNILKPVRFPIPVISIGNVSWGGNGKTPMVEYLCWQFLQCGSSPLILTRGYAGGDEAKLLESHLHGTQALMGVGRDRARIASTLLTRHGLMEADAIIASISKLHLSKSYEVLSSVPHFHNTKVAQEARQSYGRLSKRGTNGVGIILLDDGMQHWKIRRDVEIVMVNAVSLFGNERLLPRGPLREPLSALGRADVLVIHNANLVPYERVQAIKSMLISIVQPNTAIFCSQIVPRYLIRFSSALVGSHGSWSCSKRESNSLVPLNFLEGRHVLIISGIGCPESLYLTLKQLGMAASIERMDFPDHYEFQNKDMDTIKLQISMLHLKLKSIPVVIITEKDYARNPVALGRLQGHCCDAFFLHSAIEVPTDIDTNTDLGFTAFIASKIESWKHPLARVSC